MIRKAVMEDIPQITQIYCDILDLEAAQKGHTGWVKGIYPSKATALESVTGGNVCDGRGRSDRGISEAEPETGAFLRKG